MTSSVSPAQMQAPADMSPVDGTQESLRRDFSSEADATSPGALPDPKKRRTGTGSRGVANLTPDQLAKKRANDREAQRAIRERTKNTIESLQSQIRELTSQQPYQELQNVLRQKELVEAENADIKRRLASALALIQPILGQQGLELPAYQPPAHPFIPHRRSSTSNINASTPSSAASPMTVATGPSQWQSPSLSISHEARGYVPVQTAQTAQTKPLSQRGYDLPPNLEVAPERLGLDFLLDGSQRLNKTPTGVNGLPPSSFHQIPRELERISPGQRSNSVVSTSTTFNASMGMEMYAHNAPIRNGPPTCPLDSLLLDFLRERRQLAAEGASISSLIGPAYPSVTSLLNPSRAAQPHPLSKVVTDILATFVDLSTLPEQVALLYIMFLIMRWQIAPTQENYDRLPDWATPRPTQLFTPHPAWIDHLPWPKMRDRLVRDYSPREYLFDNFITPFTATLNLNWPYEPTDALLSNPETDEWSINPVFERHLRSLENWSLGSAFANAYPRLADTYRLKGDRG